MQPDGRSFRDGDPSDIDTVVEPAHPNLLRMERILQRNRVGQWLPLVVFAVSIFLTYQAWRDAERTSTRTMRTEFDFRVRESIHRIEQRMQAYEQILYGAAGLFASIGLPSRGQFRTYVDALRLQQHYPGIQGIGFALLLSPDTLPEHVEQMHQQGFTDYAVTPPGRRPVMSSILYLEPFYGRNLRAFGYDMYSDPVRREAMERARDTGQPALSGKVRLVQETGQDPQMGFLLYLPVYREATVPTSLAQRRDALVGWIHAPFRMRDWIEGLHGAGAGELDMEIYDGRAAIPEALMLDLDPALRGTRGPDVLSRTDVLHIGGREWTVVSYALPSLDRRSGFGKSEWIVAFGLGASLLLALLSWLFVDDRIYAMRAARQAMQLALYDSLTGLPNRQFIADLTSSAIERCRRDGSRLALLFIDLDRFKPVNDTHGHGVGDLLLKEVAVRLRRSIRRSDTAARLGGDEFVILLPHLQHRTSAQAVAEKILASLVQPFNIAGHSLQISASIGVAYYPEDGQDATALLKQADMAMYDAKGAGRNRIASHEGERLAFPHHGE